MPRRGPKITGRGRRMKDDPLVAEMRLHVNLQTLNCANSVGEGMWRIQKREGIIDTGWSQANWQVFHNKAPMNPRYQKKGPPERFGPYKPLLPTKAKLTVIAPYVLANNVQYVPILDAGGQHGMNPWYRNFTDRGLRSGLFHFRRSPFHNKDLSIPIIRKWYQR